VQPDLWVLPEGVKIYLATARPENNQYLLLGPGAGEAYKSALNGKNGDFLDSRNDCSIVESKTFEVPGVDQPVDPLSREVTVGEYTTMFDTVSSVLAAGEYRSAMRDIIIYDEAKVGGCAPHTPRPRCVCFWCGTDASLCAGVWGVQPPRMAS
jgi:hypothetical protein